MKKCIAVVTFAMLALYSDSLRAQSCLGRTSFELAPTNVSLGASFGEGTKGVGSTLAFGGGAGFGGVGVGYTSYDDADVSATSFSGTAGFQVKPSASSKVQICPLASAAFGYGPNVDTDFGKLKTTTLGFFGGVAIGGEVEVSEGFSVIPNLSGGVLHQRAKVSLDGDSESGDDTGGLIQGGVSLLINRTFAIVPSIAIPVGFDSNDTIFSIGVVIGFKRSK